MLTRYAIERLLFRLSQTDAVERYVLKGAMLFVTWPQHVFRPTGDLDLLGHGDPTPTALMELFTRICHIEAPADGIFFDPTTLKVESVREADKYQGARLSVKADLAGAKIHVLIDIGFGDHVYPDPKHEIFPTLLPGLPQGRILMYPPETVISEKFEAMIRFGEANGRIKDFHDIWVTTQTFRFDLVNVVEAVHGTLRRRETAIPSEMPIGLTGVFAAIVEERGLWSGFLRRASPAMGLPSFSDVQSELRSFFGPIIATLGAPEGAQGIWHPDSRSWRNS
ncbi:nucleotidyl transferase AbiEii/AbiGii toxin family protein [Gluconacetobacter entanii]|uniref:nucleotidyl transferase AbiEii/AbiGii toxin family protein n=1 Tax=Gluconacetobacter entanii TaxID=108528 RepID=UPI001C933D4E|nr:nucleotidyl transferase AbiEii/AbiGii toxin family protein [Gluconacetobacter entanii]MBY4640510.1 nucleotidyl transferase AbiEii/AbiGii toxin family protein [Gluconacetobacter entanii]MCW4579109.1 nucleotidyl transferase AbiEii/AbiGii toxin family protein [Gluconacetobacter entanii]MCW4582518.1 nucleotidyl transferase AbiEii/AbiGii toxin family protein [Gluconacetobacter entanii]MCW4585883.1 nucleotidyl transferase AbiEii/AbiGii toxin family protein [Gluconacetobacter entanii]